VDGRVLLVMLKLGEVLSSSVFPMRHPGHPFDQTQPGIPVSSSLE
jgi:hypothetical protein